MNQVIKKRIEDINNGIVPEGYKQTPFGIFPCDWETKCLDDICVMQGGGTPDTKNQYYWQGDIPWISSSDLNEDDYYNVNITRYITQDAVKKSATKVCPSNSIALVTRVGVGKIALIDRQYCTSQDFTNIIDTKCYTLYLLYQLKSVINRKLKECQGTSIKGITTKELQKLQIDIPQKEIEQSKIAEILMKWDEAVELQEQYIQKLELRKKAIMKKLLTPKDDWKSVQVKDIFEITRGQVLPISACNNSYQHPVYSSQTANNGLMGYYHEYLFEDCITWTTDGANAGEVKFRKGKFYCTNVCGVLKSVEGFANECVAYIINSVSKSYVSYVGNPKLMNNTMGNIKILLPTIEEQKHISNFIEVVDEEISLQKEKLDRIKIQRKAMQQYLLTGIVRVG